MLMKSKKFIEWLHCKDHMILLVTIVDNHMYLMSEKLRNNSANKLQFVIIQHSSVNDNETSSLIDQE